MSLRQVARWENITLGLNGVVGPFSLENIDMLHLWLEVQSSTGDGSGFSMWLQSSPDDGLTWYDVPCDWTTEASHGGERLSRRNCVDTSQVDSGSAGLPNALFRHVPGDLGRLRFQRAGTGSYTVNLTLTGK